MYIQNHLIKTSIATLLCLMFSTIILAQNATVKITQQATMNTTMSDCSNPLSPQVKVVSNQLRMNWLSFVEKASFTVYYRPVYSEKASSFKKLKEVAQNVAYVPVPKWGNGITAHTYRIVCNCSTTSRSSGMHITIKPQSLVNGATVQVETDSDIIIDDPDTKTLKEPKFKSNQPSRRTPPKRLKLYKIKD